MTRYLISDTAEAAERIIAFVGEKVTFGSLSEAQEWLVGHPQPNRYRVWELHQDEGGWKATAPTEGGR